MTLLNVKSQKTCDNTIRHRSRLSIMPLLSLAYSCRESRNCHKLVSYQFIEDTKGLWLDALVVELWTQIPFYKPIHTVIRCIQPDLNALIPFIFTHSFIAAISLFKISFGTLLYHIMALFSRYPTGTMLFSSELNTIEYKEESCIINALLCIHSLGLNVLENEVKGVIYFLNTCRSQGNAPAVL